jgi:hypothetical protein
MAVHENIAARCMTENIMIVHQSDPGIFGIEFDKRWSVAYILL